MKNILLGLVVAGMLLAGAGTGFAQVVTTMITGGDAGQGLTLTPGNVVSARNIQGGDFTLQGVTFQNQAVGSSFGGFTTFAGGETSANDTAMTNLLNQGGFAAGTSGLNVIFSGLTPNAAYQLDLLQSVLQYSGREQAILVNGALVTRVDLAMNRAYNTTLFTTADSGGIIGLLITQSAGYGGTGYQDGAVLNAVVLSTSAIPEPATYAAILGAAAMALAMWRRRIPAN